MCGIIGYIGKKNPVETLIMGLKRLEYRGYDSSGIAIKGENNVQLIKSTGRISKLEEKINKTKVINGNIGIAHTRWATHGVPTITNAHPHQVGRVTIVHNGIIENAEELKNELLKEGQILKSDTDTEVACAIINKYYKNNPIEAITKATHILKGSYAFGIIFEDIDKLYAVRKDSPLIIGIGKGENYLASDIAAIINYTNKYILLNDNEVVELNYDSVKVYKENKEIKKDISTTRETSEEANKGSYKHYMLKEIMEEPLVLARTLNKYINDMHKIYDISSYEEIHIVACGSAMYAGLIGKSLITEKANIKCFVESASEYRYEKVIYNKKTLVILVSQSGETADTIAAMRKAKENNIDTLAIVNVKTSTIAREADNVIFIEAGPEIAVATTKAYLLQVAILSLIALKAAHKKSLEPKYTEILAEVKELPTKLQKVLNDHDKFLKMAQDIYKSHDVFYIGRGVDYAMCLEGCLKLKEVSYTHSDAYQAGELKHGPISLIEKDTPVFAIVTDDNIKDKTKSNIIEVASRGAKVFTITNDNTLKEHYLNYVVEKINPYFQPILVVPPLQLIGYYVGDLKKLDIDKPRNLAKSVTVE